MTYSYSRNTHNVCIWYIKSSFGNITSWFFNLFNWKVITLQYCFLPYISMNQPCVRMCLPSPDHPPHSSPHSIPPGCHTAVTLAALLHSSNLHWSSFIHTGMYTQVNSLNITLLVWFVFYCLYPLILLISTTSFLN